MAEGTYEYECMRAELLGVAKPDFEEFQQRKREAEENRRLAEVEVGAVDAENLAEAEHQGEVLQETGGKLEELNSILSATQKRLDRFKVRCGSVTELIKTKIGSISGNGEASSSSESPEVVQQEVDTAIEAVKDIKHGRTELERAMDNHVDKLDSLLEKAERAEISLHNQNKQIKSYLK